MARRPHPDLGRAFTTLDPGPDATTPRAVCGQRQASFARRARVRSAGTLTAALIAVLLAGGAALSNAIGSPAAPSDPLANTVRALGGAPALGPPAGLRLNANFVDVAPTPSGSGYWTVASDGGVFGYGDARFYGSMGGFPMAAPVVGIAATPSGHGYWLVASDGGVFGFGDAGFHGSASTSAFSSLIAPIVAIAATPTGKGYWLVGGDGGVFGFGDAAFEGSATTIPHNAPIVAVAPTQSGFGYYLLAADGGVFGFGDARFYGSTIDTTHVATGIALASNGRGYMVSRRDGSVLGFGSGLSQLAPFDPLAGQHPTVGIAGRHGGGVWLALSYSPPPPPVVDLSQDPFLKCTRAHESDTAGGYRARSSDGLYYGAYQFLKSTWNSVARAMGRFDLVGVDPAAASPADQDALALFLFHAAGTGPWGGRCGGMG